MDEQQFQVKQEKKSDSELDYNKPGTSKSILDSNKPGTSKSILDSNKPGSSKTILETNKAQNPNVNPKEDKTKLNPGKQSRKRPKPITYKGSFSKLPKTIIELLSSDSDDDYEELP